MDFFLLMHKSETARARGERNEVRKTRPHGLYNKTSGYISKKKLVLFLLISFLPPK